MERDNLPLVTTREDLCPRGRKDVLWRYRQVPHTGEEVIIIPPLRLVYVLGKKCGSSTIRQFFKTFFNVTFEQGAGELTCDDPRPSANRICPSTIVDDEVVNSHFSFGVVRDPVSRFYSALKEANLQAELAGLPPPYQSRADIQRLLQEQMGPENRSCGYDRHLASQLTELFTPFDSRYQRQGVGGDRMLPLDFLGCIDNLAEEVMAALLLASDRAGKPLTAAEATAYYDFLKTAHFRAAGTKNRNLTLPVDEARDGELDEMVKRAHAQDLVCIHACSKT